MHILYQAIKDGIVKPIYDSIIVDEAQDLSPCKLRILAGLVKRLKNGLFLLLDKTSVSSGWRVGGRIQG